MPVRFRPFSACRAQYYGTVRGVQGGGRGVARMKKRVAACLAALFACAAAFCAFQLGGTLLEYRAGRREYAVLAQYSPVQAQNGAQAADGETGGQLQADFEALRQIDENVVAWLYGPETPVNYPVVQAADNEYYLTHMFGKKKNSAMFSSLTGYLQPGYYEQHPTLALFTPQAAYTIRVFAGYVAAPDSDAWRRAFSSQQEFLQWCEAAARRSAFDSGLVPQPGQRVVTLSTCSYEFENARFVLLGILEQTSQ